MSRGPRDLRDLICVSRLTFRESDDEIISDEDTIKGDWDEISLGSSGSCDSRQSSASKPLRKSPDSGCVTNESSPSDTTCVNNGPGTDLKLDLSSLNLKKKSRKKKRVVNKDVPKFTEIPKFAFPKPPPLPPLGRSSSVDKEDDSVQDRVDNLDNTSKNVEQSKSTSQKRKGRGKKTGIKDNTGNKSADTDSVVSDSTDNIDSESTPVTLNSSGRGTYRVTNASHAETGDYDNMLCYMDATVVSGWLTRANKNVSEVATYIHADDENFVQFAHFWLTDFGDTQKREIFELELEILREELGFAFAPGRDEGKVSQRDISNLIGAIFREYPAKLLSAKGNFLFLDYLDTITSTKSQKYKKLLSDVKCSTKNRQYAQWFLATRSFALVSIWCAIVNFYRNLLGRHGNSDSKSAPIVPSSFKTINDRRLFLAIRRGFTDVVHYLHVGDHVNLHLIDNHERTLIFTAVMHNQPKLLNYLITRVRPAIDVNHVSDTGNTALHAAVNNGNAQLVAVLLKSEHINVDCINPQCENASPLHLAVMHGHKDVVDLLLKAGADRTLKMGDMTAIDIARDFDHSELLQLLQT
ncbi:hypothetical protein ACF0H5_000821 [Mactra antiquata]